MATLTKSRKVLEQTIPGPVNLSMDLAKSYGKGKGFEGNVVDICIGAIRSVSIASGFHAEEAKQCERQFLKNYSKMSKSGIEVSPTSIVGAFKNSLTPEMQTKLDSMLTEPNRGFVNNGVAIYEGQKQDGVVRTNHSHGAGLSMG